MGKPDTVNITIHAVIKDNDREDLYNREMDKRIEGGNTFVEIRAPGNIVPPVVVNSSHPHVAGHELKQHIGVTNQQFAMDALPEAQRRKDERRMRRRQQAEKARFMRQAERCKACGGTGWIPDEEGNTAPCILCDAYEETY